MVVAEGWMAAVEGWMVVTVSVVALVEVDLGKSSLLAATLVGARLM